MVVRIYTEASVGSLLFEQVSDVDVSDPAKITFKHILPGGSEQSTAMFFTGTIIGASLDPQ